MAHNEKHPDKANSFHVEGQILREQPECESGDLSLAAYVFDKAGILLGNTSIDGNGNYHVAITIDRPIDVELVIGPEGDAQKIRHSSAYSKMFSADEWKNNGTQFKLNYETLLPLSIWRPWWPQRICISGHVRKIVQQGDVTDICPVPYVKVEVFDVDRDTCFWPWLRNRPDLVLDRAVIRVPDLIKQPSFPPRPIPRPDPVPELNFEQALTPIHNIGTSPLEQIGFNPRPDPPISLPGASTMAFTRVGEASQMDTSIARRVDKLTFTSKRAPWYILPRCFYSKSLVCETTTDCNGAFKCCFSWWPFYFRKGRLSFDSRPDCSGLIELDTLMRDNNRQLLRYSLWVNPEARLTGTNGRAGHASFFIAFLL